MENSETKRNVHTWERRLMSDNCYSMVEIDVTSEWNALVAERNLYLKVIKQIADPSFVGNFGPDETVEIYRRWAKYVINQKGD